MRITGYAVMWDNEMATTTTQDAAELLEKLLTAAGHFVLVLPVVG